MTLDPTREADPYATTADGGTEPDTEPLWPEQDPIDVLEIAADPEPLPVEAAVDSGEGAPVEAPPIEAAPTEAAMDVFEATAEAMGPVVEDAEPKAEIVPDEPPVLAVGPSTPPTVGRAIADALRAAGVRVAYTVPGESFLGLLESLVPAGIRVVATRHENGAGFMAEAHGQLTGRPAACLATRAVGAANLAIAIQTAREDSTPMFAIIGGVNRRNRGREAFQEADIPGSIGHMAKWSVEITDAASVVDVMAEATRQALGGRPGPVVIAVPEDLQDEPMPASTTVAPVRVPIERIDPAMAGRILHLLTAAHRPVILAGAGILRARCTNDLVKLAEMIRVPVMASWRRPDVFPNDHPLYLGMTGYASPPVVRQRLEEADLVLVLGSRLNEITTFDYAWPGPATRWIHIDAAPIGERPGSAAPLLQVTADARGFVRACLARLGNTVLDKVSADAREAEAATTRATWHAETAIGDSAWSGPGVHPGRVLATLRAVFPDEAIVTTDAGNFAGWAGRHLQFQRPGTFLGPTSGAMGYALPAAIAASLVQRDRPVVALAGDGGFAMTMAELETAVRTHARVTVLVFDNERYGTIRMHQDHRHDPDPVATDLGPVDFAGVATAMGAIGVRCDTDAAVEPALRAALEADRPTVIQLALDRSWVSVDDHPA